MRILHGLLFYPRGGSAFVARALAHKAQERGNEVQIVSGSLGSGDTFSNATTFYAGLPTAAMNYDHAQQMFLLGTDPMTAPQPFHPSYEDRGRVPDRLLSAVSPELLPHFVASWARVFSTVKKTFVPEVLHMHHLTPQLRAAVEVFPDTPLVVHLHGTELKHMAWMQEHAGTGKAHARYADFWLQEMIAVSRLAGRVMALSPADVENATRILGLPQSRIDLVPNGVDVALFQPKRPQRRELSATLLKHVAENGLGWDESGVPGSVRYTTEDARELASAYRAGETLLIYVGRFLAVKRVTLLLEAIGRLHTAGLGVRLVIWGGFPGEWEGEHPHAVATRLGLRGVYFVGWKDHDELSEVLPQFDALVLPSSDESFGLVLLEAMACRVPVVAADCGGPPSVVGSDSGWLFHVDDLDSLTNTLRTVIMSPQERIERGAAALRAARDRFSWDRVYETVESVYRSAVGNSKVPD